MAPLEELMNSLDRSPGPLRHMMTMLNRPKRNRIYYVISYGDTCWTAPLVHPGPNRLCLTLTKLWLSETMPILPSV